MFIDFNLPGFTNITSSERSVEEPAKYFITNFCIFTKELFQHIFDVPCICGIFVITLAGIIGLLIFRKKTDIKYTVISLAIFVSIFIFEYSLLICGRTYYDHKSFWFASHEVSFVFIFPSS